MIQDLCVIMLTAGITSLLFKLFKQPVVLGYIIAGLLVGPYVCGASWITDAESVETWGQIGVLFLLFAMGLEFSFKKLIAMGSTAIIAAGTVVVGMMSVGFLAGRLMGWNEINSLFLGGMICMSSTTIVFKAIDDMNLSSHKFASVAMGILIVEDLFAVVLMVLLSSIAVEQKFSGDELISRVWTLALYLVLWFVLGIYLLPTFLRKFKKHLNDETLVIFAVGLCLGMVLFSVKAGFSSALGAFVMGSILAETLEAERIEKLVQPIKNVFGSIFFVTVGMMIQPSLLAEYWLPIAIITIIVIVGQIFFGSLGTLLSGQTLKVSLQTGFCLVQVGEFAFIIAQFGQSAGVTDASLYPIVVAVSVITTFLTPYVMRMAIPAHDYLSTHMNSGLLLLINRYSESRNQVGSSSLWKNVLSKVGVTILINTVIIIFMDLLYFRYAYPWILEHARILMHYFSPRTSVKIAELLSVVIILFLNAPFLHSIAVKNEKIEDSDVLWQQGNHQKMAIITIRIMRIVYAILIVSLIIFQVYDLTISFLALISLLVVLVFIFSQGIRRQSMNIKTRFQTNLTARDSHAEKHGTIARQFVSSLLPYDLHIATIELPPNSIYSGKTLSEMNIRRNSGASVVRVIRGDVDMNIPGGGKHIYPGDKLVVAGTDEQIDALKKMFERSIRRTDATVKRIRIDLEHFVVEEGSTLVGLSIAESRIRDKARCIVMGIRRGEDEYIMNPEPNEIFQPADVVLVAGESDSVINFLKTL